MARSIEKLFRAPYAMPNGVQATEQGLWIADQMADRVALVRLDAPPDAEYGVPWLLHEIPTESSNTSGLTFGGGSLWLAANGPGERWRKPRPADAATGEILRVDPATGRTQQRRPLPGGGGTHGIDYDRYDEGTLWLTTLKSQTATQVRIEDWSVRRAIPLPYSHGHGIARVEDGLWVVHKAQWVIVKLDLEDGAERDRIEIPPHYPEVHCLSAYGDGFLYCDATSGWVVQITGH